MKAPVAYIVANRKYGTIYTGVTSDLIVRIQQHKEGTYEGFSKKYGTNLLVWYEVHEKMESAILREKQIKKWNREWKVRLIESNNPDWKDLYSSLFD